MTRGQRIIEKIQSIFAGIRQRYQHIIDQDLYNNGAIYYMNKCDGTEFTWKAHSRCCEFYILHPNKMGFIKLNVNKGDTYTAYVYQDSGYITTENYRNIETNRGSLSDGDSSYLAAILYAKADMENIRDASITEIDFSYEPDECELQNFGSHK